jgi:hypothetical protein
MTIVIETAIESRVACRGEIGEVFGGPKAVMTAANMLPRHGNQRQLCECRLRRVPKRKAGLLASSPDGQSAAGGGMPATDRERPAGRLVGRTADPQGSICSACR